MATVGGLFSGIGGIETGFEKPALKSYGLMKTILTVFVVLNTIINISYILKMLEN